MFCFMRRAFSYPSSSYFEYTSRRFVKHRYASELMVRVDRLSEMLEYDKSEMAYDLKRHKLIDRMSPENMEINVNLLLKFGFSKQYIVDYLHMIAFSPLVLRNRLQICQEIGCPLSKMGPIVLNFQKFFKFHIPLLKAYGVLSSPDIGTLAERLGSYLDLSSNEFTKNIDETNRIVDIYNIMYKSYLLKEMPSLKDLSEIEVGRKFERITSLQNYRKNVKFLTEVLKFNSEEMITYKSLLFVDCGNMMALLQSSHGMRIKDLVPQNPELLDVLKDRYDQVYKLVKYAKIDFSVFLKSPSHFNMDFKDFEYHFSNCMTSPFLSVFKYHHKLPFLIERSRIANERVQILNHINMKCYNLSILTGDTNKFLKFVSDGVDKINAEDTFIMLSNELKKPITVIRVQLKKNAYIEYVSIGMIKANLDYLRELGFNDEDIYRNIQLLLYPKNIVHDNIMKIHLGELVIYKGNEKLLIDRKDYLSLALYSIEKEHNFSCSYMWERNERIENVGESDIGDSAMD